jgi:hypothetical protein
MNTLTEIFERAGEARISFPSRYPDVAALDALSLRSRAVRTIVPLVGKKGRQLLVSMSHPNVPRPPCGEAVAPNAGIYIDTVEAVSRQGQLTDLERERGAVDSDYRCCAWCRKRRRDCRCRAAPSATVRIEREQAEMTAALAFGLAVQDSDRAFTGMPPATLVGSLVGAGTFLRRVNQLAFAIADRQVLDPAEVDRLAQAYERFAPGRKVREAHLFGYTDLRAVWAWVVGNGKPTEDTPRLRAVGSSLNY